MSNPPPQPKSGNSFQQLPSQREFPNFIWGAHPFSFCTVRGCCKSCFQLQCYQMSVGFQNLLSLQSWKGKLGSFLTKCCFVLISNTLPFFKKNTVVYHSLKKPICQSITSVDSMHLQRAKNFLLLCINSSDVKEILFQMDSWCKSSCKLVPCIESIFLANWSLISFVPHLVAYLPFSFWCVYKRHIYVFFLHVHLFL